MATTAAPPPPKRVEVSLRPHFSSVSPGKSRRLSGKVSDPEAEVSLYADPYPYGGERFVRRLTVRSDGTFATRVRPKRGTRYRAIVAGRKTERSASVQVFAYLPHKMKIDQVGVTGGRATITWRAPGVRLQRQKGSDLCLYMRPSGRKRWQRMRCGKAKRSGARLVSTMTFNVPAAGRRYVFVACTRSEIAKGFISSHARGCGRRTINKMRSAPS